jgi:hypothetical protein
MGIHINFSPIVKLRFKISKRNKLKQPVLKGVNFGVLIYIRRGKKGVWSFEHHKAF